MSYRSKLLSFNNTQFAMIMVEYEKKNIYHHDQKKYEEYFHAKIKYPSKITAVGLALKNFLLSTRR